MKVPPPADRLWWQRCSGTRHRSGQTGCCLGWSPAWSRKSGVRRRCGRCVGFYLLMAPTLPGSSWAGNSGANGEKKKKNVVSLYSVRFSFWAIKMLFSHRAPCNDSACFSALFDRIFVNGFCSACRFWRSLYKHSNQTFIFLWPTFPAPVDPATASIFPFSRYRLMFLRTGVT